MKYEFAVEFDVSLSPYVSCPPPLIRCHSFSGNWVQIPVTYPTTAPEIAIPELDGKTAKMYRGGKICLSDHFKPLWARNVPKFGIAHAMALGLGPWLAVEVPDLIQKGFVVHKEQQPAS